MNVHISYKVSKSPEIEREFNLNIEKLRRRLQVFRPELIHLRGAIEENSAREGFTVSLNLRLPSGQLAAQEAGPSAVGSIKSVFEDLVEQLIKHKDRLRQEHKWIRRRRVGRTRPLPQVPFEETLAAVQPPMATGADVESYINANLHRLERFVGRELRFRQNSGELRPDEVTREEVIDEVVAAALGDEEEKPERLGLEPWLYRLALRAIHVLAARSREQVETVPLEASARKPNNRASDEAQLQFHQPDEVFTGETVTADPRVATPEEVAASDEMITLVEAALLGVPREQRDAFILFAIEGFTLEEIAAISDRSVEKVRAAIAAARERLQKTAGVPNEFAQKLLQHSRIA